MTQPVAFVPNHNYSSELGTEHGTHLDVDFAGIKATSDAIRANLALIQRDDSKLKNASVHPDAFNSASLALIAATWVPKGLWTTLTIYAVGDVVEQTGDGYVCASAHTSGTFATDKAAGKWVTISSGLGAATDGYELRGNGSNFLSLPPGCAIDTIINGQIVPTYAANAVTYTLKGKGGVDLSAANPCYLLFHSSALSGDFDIIKVTVNLPIPVSFGSTLGHASGRSQHTFIYAINNAGTAELAVSNLPPDYPTMRARRITTTAEGGAGGADSATGIYSTTARTNVPKIPLCKVLGSQAAAGTWVTPASEVSMAPFTLPMCAFSAHMSAVTSTNINTATKMGFDSVGLDTEALYDTANKRYQPYLAGLYRFRHLTTCAAFAGASRLDGMIYVDGVQGGTSYAFGPAGAFPSAVAEEFILLNGTTSYVEAYALQTDSNPLNVGSTSSAAARFTGMRVV